MEQDLRPAGGGTAQAATPRDLPPWLAFRRPACLRPSELLLLAALPPLALDRGLRPGGDSPLAAPLLLLWALPLLLLPPLAGQERRRLLRDGAEILLYRAARSLRLLLPWLFLAAQAAFLARLPAGAAPVPAAPAWFAGLLAAAAGGFHLALALRPDGRFLRLADRFAFTGLAVFLAGLFARTGVAAAGSGALAGWMAALPPATLPAAGLALAALLLELPGRWRAPAFALVALAVLLAAPLWPTLLQAALAAGGALAAGRLAYSPGDPWAGLRICS